MDYKSILTIWFCIEISRNEWDIGFWGMCWLLQKMAAIFGFWMIGERDFPRDPKKYTFGKSIFKTFSKNRKSQILPPFLSTWHSWIYSDMDVFLSVNGGSKIFLRSDPSGPRSTYTTNPTINRLICSRIDDSLLCKFSQNVLQIDMLRENTWELICSCRLSGPFNSRPSGSLTVGPPAL